jgi:hypothetical protein
VLVRLLARQKQVLRSWPAGLVPGLRDAALDSSFWCRDEARLAASGGVAGSLVVLMDETSRAM